MPWIRVGVLSVSIGAFANPDIQFHIRKILHRIFLVISGVCSVIHHLSVRKGKQIIGTFLLHVSLMMSPERYNLALVNRVFLSEFQAMDLDNSLFLDFIQIALHEHIVIPHLIHNVIGLVCEIDMQGLYIPLGCHISHVEQHVSKMILMGVCNHQMLQVSVITEAKRLNRGIRSHIDHHLFSYAEHGSHADIFSTMFSCIFTQVAAAKRVRQSLCCTCSIKNTIYRLIHRFYSFS